nr:glutamyl-trna(gln) amidotransferase subunit a [Quercus suber]
MSKAFTFVGLVALICKDREIWYFLRVDLEEPAMVVSIDPFFRTDSASNDYESGRPVSFTDNTPERLVSAVHSLHFSSPTTIHLFESVRFCHLVDGVVFGVESMPSVILLRTLGRCKSTTSMGYVPVQAASGVCKPSIQRARCRWSGSSLDVLWRDLHPVHAAAELYSGVSRGGGESGIRHDIGLAPLLSQGTVALLSRASGTYLTFYRPLSTSAFERVDRVVNSCLMFASRFGSTFRRALQTANRSRLMTPSVSLSLPRRREKDVHITGDRVLTIRDSKFLVHFSDHVSHAVEGKLGIGAHDRSVQDLPFVEQSEASLLTVIRTPQDKGVSAITASWLKRVIEEYRQDDVFRSEFLQGIAFWTGGAPDPELTPSVQDFLAKLGVEWTCFLKASKSGQNVRAGPYVVMDAGLREVWRLFSDDQQAFLLTLQPGLQDPFAELRVKTAGDGNLDVAVPSRLRYHASHDLPMHGLRVAVKDNMHMKGLKTSLCNRAYSQTYPAQSTTAVPIQRLIDCGAIILGKTKLGSFGHWEEPMEYIDYPAPWNPRGDGYQSPGGSSSGSAAAVAAYDWLDIGIGADTAGSIMRPALWNGVFGMRPTHNAISNTGLVPSIPDLTKCRTFAAAWYGKQLPETAKQANVSCVPNQTTDHLGSTDEVMKSFTRIVYPRDYWTTIEAEQCEMAESLIKDLENTMGIKRTVISFEEDWALGDIWYDEYSNTNDFRTRYREKFDKEAFVSPPVRAQWAASQSITKSQRDEALRRLRIFRQWFHTTLMDNGRTNAIWVLPVENLKPRYRDRTLDTDIVTSTNVVLVQNYSYMSRISQREEDLFFAVGLMSLPGSDLALIDVATQCLSQSGRPLKVQSGRSAFARGQADTVREALCDVLAETSVHFNFVPDSSHPLIAKKCGRYIAEAICMAFCDVTADAWVHKPEVTAEDYAFAVEIHANRSTYQTLYPGQIYEDLAAYLKGPFLPTRNVEAPDVSSIRTRSHAVHYLLESTGSKTLTAFSASQACIGVLQTASRQKSSQLLFLNGYSSQEWVTGVGAVCETDPEFFNSNMIFRCRRTYFSYPSLSSAYPNIVRLRIMTIGSRDPRGSRADSQRIDRLRADAATSMSIYRHELMLNSNVCCGDSIVRQYHVLDEKYFVLEQEIAVALHLHGKKGWIGMLHQPADLYFVHATTDREYVALICSDIGHSLAEGPRGPWLTDSDLKSPVEGPFFYPTFQHVENIALNSSVASTVDQHQDDRKFPQTAALLSSNYGHLLDTGVMASDPFYALMDLFRFTAASENQFLNLMDDYIGRETGHSILKVKQPSLSNLLYCQEILEDHTSRLKETTKFVRRRGGPQWPRVARLDKERYAVAESAAEALLSDFEQLEERSRLLIERCSKGMSVIMGSVLLAENRQAIAQGKRVTKLTFIAFLYIPLSFTTSFFGMNVEQLGTEGVPIWAWAIMTVPVLLLTVLVYFLDVQTATTWIRKLWSRVARTAGATDSRRTVCCDMCRRRALLVD